MDWTKSGTHAAAIAVAAFLALPASAQQGVSGDKVVFGQAAVFDGPAAALGKGMNLGIRAAFDEQNKAGGVKGRKLDLVAKDDGYEPDRSVTAVNELLDQAKVFALIGPVGTPTASATQPIATQKEVPFIGAFTGAGFLRNPQLANVINVRASYGQETEAWVKHLTEDRKAQKIAILYQDDSFGQAGLSGVKAAMDKRGMKLAAEGTFKRNTVAVKTALLEIRKANPDAVVMVGPYKPCAEFIKLAKQVGMKSAFVNISFVGADALAAELGPEGDGVIVSQVVPFPQDTKIPVVARYHAALKAIDAQAKPGFISLEGYLVGRMAIMALEKVEGAPTRKSFLDAIYKAGKFDLGGMTLQFGPGDNQGSDQVFMTIIQADGSFKAVDKL